MLKDLVVGCITKYGWAEIEPWVISLERSGFTGHKAMIVLEGKKELLDKLVSRNFTVIGMAKNDAGDATYSPNPYSIVVQRFYHLWELLTAYEKTGITLNNIISTDVKDVIFQTNPSDYLDKHLRMWNKLCVGSESLRYKEEAWGWDNIQKCYPMYARYMAETPIYNAGTIAGRHKEFKDFCAVVHMISLGCGWNPDQAALNIVLSMEPYKSMTLFNKQEDGWCAQLGTTGDPSKMDAFRPNLLGPEPSYLDGEWYTYSGEKFTLVHQWDRTPYANDVRRKYHE